MYTFLTILHVFVCIFLMLVVLLQAGRGGGIGLAFGGSGGSQSVFGSSGGATFLTKLTAVCAVIFFTNSLALAYMSSQSDSRRLQRIAEQKAHVKKAEEAANAKTLGDIAKQREAQEEKDKAAAAQKSEAEQPGSAPAEGTDKAAPVEKPAAPAPLGNSNKAAPSLKLTLPGEQPAKPRGLAPGAKLDLTDKTAEKPAKAPKPVAATPAPKKKANAAAPAGESSEGATAAEDKPAVEKKPAAEKKRAAAEDKEEGAGEKPAAE